MFKVQQSNAYIERLILTAMIVNDQALRQISLRYKQKYFAADFARKVAQWCITYQEKYNKSPGKDIQTIFESHRRNGLDEESSFLVSQFLSSISDEFERQDNFNEGLAIDEALKYFHERSLVILKEDLDYWLESGNLNQAHAAVAEFVAPANNITMGYEPLKDVERIKIAFSKQSTLFELPGALGKLINRLERGNSIAVIGKYKATKSFTSQYIGFQALFSNLNVAWFDFEMGEERINRRIFQALCAMPLRPPRGERLVIPVWDCLYNQLNSCNKTCRTNQIALRQEEEKKPEFHKAPPSYKPCDACKENKLETWFVEKKEYTLLDWRTAWKKAQAVAGSVMGARLKVQTWPKFSAGIEDIKATLHIWRHIEGFTPDILIIDQPSGMKLTGKGDFRHQIDELWKRLCALPQELHCLGLYPSQAGGKDAQERSRLRDSDIAEHSGILGHVDGTIKIDQNQDDKIAKRSWYSIGVDRDDEATSEYCCVLQALTIGQPVLDSRFG